MQQILTLEIYAERIPKNPGYVLREHEALNKFLADGWELVELDSNHVNEGVYSITVLLEKEGGIPIDIPPA